MIVNWVFIVMAAIVAGLSIHDHNWLAAVWAVFAATFSWIAGQYREMLNEVTEMLEEELRRRSES